MSIQFYHIDAFTREPFGGNPAAVCLLESWLEDRVMQLIAAENGLPETAFLIAGEESAQIRWFTPAVEVDLCGHATLAAGFVLLEHTGRYHDRVRFESKSGSLEVRREDGLLWLNLPARPGAPKAAPAALAEGLGVVPDEVLWSRDAMAVLDSETAVRAIRPDFGQLAGLDCLGVIVTAPGDECDFVSRFFAPGAGVPEDPVTGSAHCTLVPYWANRLGKTELEARQLSARGGQLSCHHHHDRIEIGGHAVLFAEGKIAGTGFDRVGVHARTHLPLEAP